MKASGVRNILVFFVFVLVGTASMYFLSGPGAKVFKASIILDDTVNMAPEVSEPVSEFVTPEKISNSIDTNLILNDDGTVENK